MKQTSVTCSVCQAPLDPDAALPDEGKFEVPFEAPSPFRTRPGVTVGKIVVTFETDVCPACHERVVRHSFARALDIYVRPFQPVVVSR